MEFIVSYFFGGNGEVEIEAKNEIEAREKFFEGDYPTSSEQEWGENYSVADINLKEKAK